jgi:hypothetical protein
MGAAAQKKYPLTKSRGTNRVFVLDGGACRERHKKCLSARPVSNPIFPDRPTSYCLRLHHVSVEAGRFALAAKIDRITKEIRANTSPEEHRKNRERAASHKGPNEWMVALKEREVCLNLEYLEKWKREISSSATRGAPVFLATPCSGNPVPTTRNSHDDRTCFHLPFCP